MKKIFESDYHSIDDYYRVEKVYVYALENDDEFWQLKDMNHKAMCRHFDVYEERGVASGAKYHKYEFVMSDAHVIVTEIVALNV